MHRGRHANEEYDSRNCFRVWLTQGWVLHAAQDRFHCFLGSHQELIPAWAGAEQSSLLSRNPLLSPSGVKQRLGTAERVAFEGRCQPMHVQSRALWEVPKEKLNLQERLDQKVKSIPILLRDAQPV